MGRAICARWRFNVWPCPGGRRFDRTKNAHLPPRVRPFRSIVALLLALAWLPATLHCGLAALDAGEPAGDCCLHAHTAAQDSADDSPDDSAHCGLGVCGIVESGDYQPAPNILKVSAPSAVVFVCCLIALAPELTPVPELTADAEAECPPELRRTWHFVTRAALSPRAPSLV